MYLLLWLIAALCIIYGIVKLVERQYVLGALLIVLGLIIGPGDVSLFH